MSGGRLGVATRSTGGAGFATRIHPHTTRHPLARWVPGRFTWCPPEGIRGSIAEASAMAARPAGGRGVGRTRWRPAGFALTTGADGEGASLGGTRWFQAIA